MSNGKEQYSPRPAAWEFATEGRVASLETHLEYLAKSSDIDKLRADLGSQMKSMRIWVLTGIITTIIVVFGFAVSVFSPILRAFQLLLDL